MLDPSNLSLYLTSLPEIAFPKIWKDGKKTKGICSVVDPQLKVDISVSGCYTCKRPIDFLSQVTQEQSYCWSSKLALSSLIHDISLFKSE